MSGKRKSDFVNDKLDETFPLIGIRVNNQGRKQFVVDTKFGAIVFGVITATASAGGEGIERLLNLMLSFFGG